MNRNIEIKATSANFAHQISLAESLSDSPLEIFKQTDIFFRVDAGRLKLRIFGDKTGELIFYNRANSKEAKTSEYQITPIENPELLAETLDAALGTLGKVTKTRFLFRLGQTRIHFDKVENLGQFIEFEYVLKENESLDNGEKAIADLMKKLEISESDLIATAYFDLLNAG